MMLVEYERRGRIGIVTLNRPDRRNAVSLELHNDLEAAWKRFLDDEEAWVGILRGEGASFCAGKDLKSSREGGEATPLQRTVVNPLWVPDTDRPLIAAVQGHAIGVGWFMVAGCDYRIAAAGTVFSLPEIPAGIVGPFDFGVLEGLPYATAYELAILGRRVQAEKIQQFGLLNEVVPAEQVQDRALMVAEEFLKLPPTHVRITKTLMQDARARATADQYDRWWKIRAALEHHSDTREVRASRAEGRPANYDNPGKNAIPIDALIPRPVR
jgi:enoyl-CoA hydratase